MIVKTKDDQQYGIIRSVLSEGKAQVYMVQCYGTLSLRPCLLKCSVRETTTWSRRGSVALSQEDVVLIEYSNNHRNKKTGSISHVYSRYEKVQLLHKANEYEVPLTLAELLQEEGYDIEPVVSFADLSASFRPPGS